MHLRPLYDRLVVKRLAAETTTKGGIVIPDKSAEKSQQGEVVAVGPGSLLENGDCRALSVKTGDRVLFAQYGGTEIKLDGETFVILRESDVLAVVEQSDVKEKAA